ncbi:MAG: peptidoglycan editing factor PgeF [Leptolyngbyaceae cyanobacterium SL_7_1]|nr:peptidoglycan editing factor PgeF [Leptolyngbyaceae cyanobacterium SL_7_1]
MQRWHWHTDSDCPYLTCSLLEGFPHGFFTRSAAPRTPQELVHCFSPNPVAYHVKQVHGDRVLSTSEVAGAVTGSTPATPPEADGLVSDTSQQAVWVCTADCVPALIADSQTGQVAAVHAGWRGTAQGILPKTIERLQQHGSQLADLRIALGPAIAGEVYQVSTTVAAEVGATVVKESDDLEAVLAVLRDLPDSPLLPDPTVGRVRLDVRRINQLQLLQLGIQPDQIAIAPYCTYQHADLFFSYRRESLKQVQWSGITSVKTQSPVEL